MSKYIQLSLMYLPFCLFIAGPFLAWSQLLTPIKGFLLFLIGGLLGLLLLAGLLVRWYMQGKIPYDNNLLIYCINGLLALIFVSFVLNTFRFPLNNDVSTNTTDVPQFTKALTRSENKNRNFEFTETDATIVQKFYSDIETIRISKNPEQAVHDIEKILKQSGYLDISISETSKGFFIEAFHQSLLFSFKDDIVIRIEKATDNNTIIDIRSKSRDGRKDFGANADRIRTLSGLIKKM